MHYHCPLLLASAAAAAAVIAGVSIIIIIIIIIIILILMMMAPNCTFPPPSLPICSCTVLKAVFLRLNLPGADQRIGCLFSEQLYICRLV